MYKLPEYIETQEFNQTELEESLKSGAFNNQRDARKNLIVKLDDPTFESSVGDYLVGIRTEKRKQIPQQIETFYDTTISEFPDAQVEDETDPAQSTELSELLDEVESDIDEQKLLQSQIDELSEKLDEEIDKSVRFKEDAVQTFQASRDLIISQRIAAGEGQSPSDFSETFPFLPLSSAEKLSDDLPREGFPFMGT